MATTVIAVVNATLKGAVSGPTFTGDVDGSKFTGQVTYDAAVPPWTPPSYLRTDTRTESVPNVGRPAYLTPFTDPAFKTKIIRVTGDPGSAIRNISGQQWPDVARHHYNSDQAWNCDQSLIYLDKPGMFLHGSSYEPQFMSKNHPSDSDVRWHPADPNVMIAAYGGDKLGAWNPKTGATTQIKAFGSAYSDAKLGPWEGSPSESGDMVVISCQKSGEFIGFAYDIKNDKKYPDIKGSNISSNGIDNVRISSKGTYIVWGGNPDQVTITDLQGSVVTTLPNNYISHFDVITDGAGDEVVVGRVNSGSVGQGPDGIINKYRLRDGKRTPISKIGWSYATSSRAMPTHKWAASASADEGGSHQPGEAEVFLYNLDGSMAYRLCHHHNARNQDYVAETQPSISPDGGRVIFASTWSNNTRPVGCYVCDFRS